MVRLTEEGGAMCEGESGAKGKGARPGGALPLEGFTQLGDGQATGATALLPLLLSPQTTLESQEFQYALTRLIRGIASSRQTAKEGFFCTLTILLKYRPDFPITTLLDKLSSELKIGSLSKSETGEVCTGHILTCGAVIRSGRFVSCSEEEKTNLINTLFNASSKKAYLGLAAYSFIIDFINQSSEEEISEKLWPHLKEVLSRPLNEYTLEHLYCLLALNTKCPSIVKKHCKKKLKVPALICDETLPILSEKLMNAPEFAFIEHPIYEAFGKEISQSEFLIKFWNNEIEPKLKVQNENRILIALTILGIVLKNIGKNANQIPNLLGDQLIPCILEWFKGFQSAKQSGKMLKFKGKQKYFVHENKGKQIILKAKEVLAILQESLKQSDVNDKVKLDVLRKLLFFPGDMMFCDITNSRIIKILIENLNKEGVFSFATLLKDVITNKSRRMQMSSERPWTIMERLRAAEMLTYLINHRTTVDDVKWRIKNMQFFIQIGLFKSLENDDLYISVELSNAVKKCFFRCLSSRFPKLEALLKILTSLVEYIDNGIKTNSEAVSKNPKTFSPVVLESWESMIEFNKQINASGKLQNSKANIVFQVLSLHSGLFLLSDIMTTEMAKNSLDEVQNCYEHYIKGKTSKKRKPQPNLEDGDIVDIEPEWTEVLVDVFLSFLSRDSYLLRTVVQCVFRLLCEYLTPSAIDQILSVLDPDNDTNVLFGKDDSDDDDDDEDEEENDMESPENDDKNDMEKNSESDEDSSVIEDGSDDENDNITISDQFRMAVQKALGSAAPETDTESIDADNITEEEGKQLDNALSSAFKMLKQTKGELTKKEKKNIKTMMEFRIRVIDLINIYLEKVPSMEVCLAMVPPLFKCLEYSIKDSLQKPLEDKIRKCLKCLYSIKSFTSSEGITMEILAGYLKSITDKGTRTQFAFQAIGDVVTKCSTFIVRCSQKANCPQKSNKKKHKIGVNPISTIYKDSLEAFFTRRDCLLPVIFFHDVLHLKWDGNWDLLEKITEKTFDNSVRQYRRNEGLEMLNIFYTSLKRGAQIDSNDITVQLRKTEEQFSSALLTYLNGDNSDIANERFFALLMKVLVSMKRYHICTKQTADNINWEAVTEAVQKCREQIKLRNNQDYFKFCNLFKLDKIKNTSQDNSSHKKESIDSGHDSNTDEDLEETNIDKNKKLSNGNSVETKINPKKKNKSKNNVSKKESKMLRVQASSEGLQNISFTKLLENSNMNVDDIGEENLSEDDSKPKKKRSSDSTIAEKPKKIKKQ